MPTQTTDVSEKMREVDGVRDAWTADYGYVIVVLNRYEIPYSVFETADAYEYEAEDIFGDWMHEGEERLAVHFIDPDVF